MRFIVDECSGPAVAAWLTAQGHDVFSVFDQARGLDDRTILEISQEQNRILVTLDKDFGELIFRERRPGRGIILLRLENERRANKIAVLGRLIAVYGKRLGECFVVATESKTRISVAFSDLGPVM